MTQDSKDFAISALSGEFSCPAQERAYRTGQHAAELRQMRIVWSVALAFFALYAPFETLSSPTDGQLIALPRLLILCIGLLTMLATAVSHTRQWRDSCTSAGLLLVMLCYGWLLAGRADAGSAGALLLLIAGSYSFSPGRFVLLCSTGILGSLGAVLVATLCAPPAALPWMDFSFLLPANLLGALALAQVNRTRRQVYCQAQRLRREMERRRSAQRKLQALHQRNLDLLHNALPAVVARQLAAHPKHKPARQHALVTVLFADIVGFSQLCRRLSARRLVQLLNCLFEDFDKLAGRHGLEKIKTVGDAYLAVAGINGTGSGHAVQAALLALDLQRSAEQVAQSFHCKLRLRIGLHSGPLIAGVIGHKRYAFDVWGETVNIASRLQCAAGPGRILVSDSTQRGCPSNLLFGPVRKFQLKGCGVVQASTLYSRLSVTQL
ncbi:MAG: adenylate/guanylate cyclase domain-containing protein [Halieaceae bacterium]